MKKIFSLASTFVMVFIVATSYAATHNVTITDGGYSPNSFNATVGDTVVWTSSASNYYPSNSVSTSVPAGAATWNSGILGPSPVGAFMYVITVAGVYDFDDPAWDGYTGTFTATAPTPPVVTLHTVIISDYTFTPDSFTANVGDTVLWTAAAGNLWTDNTASTSVPTDAFSWSSGGMQPNQTFMYVITTPGVYSYQSDSFYTFTGSFTVTGPVSTTHKVLITDYTFVPDSFSANIGDTVTWVAAGTNLWTDNSASVTVPFGGTSWSSGGMQPGQTFSYVITAAGNYSYQSDSFYVFTGQFTVAGVVATGIEPVSPAPVAKLVFKNPFSDQLYLSSSQPAQVAIYDLLGNKVADTKLDFSNYPVELNMSGLSPGMYLLAYSTNGKLVHTYKAVKVN